MYPVLVFSKAVATPHRAFTSDEARIYAKGEILVHQI